MSVHRIPVMREHPIHTVFDPEPYFRDTMWRDGSSFRPDPYMDNGWRTTAVRRDPYRDHHHHSRDYYNNRELVPRDYYAPAESAGALVPVATGALPLSRSFFNPERQLSSMDHEMSRMATEMKRMYSDMQHLMPADADPDSWRTKENYLLENPFMHDNDGNRTFRLKFDVRQFRPEEIFVKTMGNELVVHAKHEEKGQGKSLHREYKRLYILPKDLSAENLQSKLTRDGVLSIEARLPPKDGHGRDKLIPITHE